MENKYTEEESKMIIRYSFLKESFSNTSAELLKLEPQVIQFLKERNATKDNPHSEYLDGETWEDYWLENGVVISRQYVEDDEGNKTYWDEA